MPCIARCSQHTNNLLDSPFIPKPDSNPLIPKL